MKATLRALKHVRNHLINLTLEGTKWAREAREHVDAAIAVIEIQSPPEVTPTPWRFPRLLTRAEQQARKKRRA